jgi:hypothetical protein
VEYNSYILACSTFPSTQIFSLDVDRVDDALRRLVDLHLPPRSALTHSTSAMDFSSGMQATLQMIDPSYPDREKGLSPEVLCYTAFATAR